MIPYTFSQAKPVWLSGRETEMNVSLFLRAVLPPTAGAALKLACHTKYQVFVNGAFFADGPARAAHGFFRVSEYDLTPVLTKAQNVVCILAAGYNANSFYLTDQPSFVCAEIESPAGVLFATGGERPFTACEDLYRTQRVQRYSFQRPFTEAYVYALDTDEILTDPAFRPLPCKLAETAPKTFIARETPYCDYEERGAAAVCGRGEMMPAAAPKRFHDRSLTDIGPALKGFPEEELSCCVIKELNALSPVLAEPENIPFAPLVLPEDGFAVYDMGLNTTGFLHLAVRPARDITLYAVFNELLPESSVPAPDANSCANAVKWELVGGRAYDLVSFEPYTYRYLQLISMGGAAEVTAVGQYRECYPAGALVNAKKMPDADLQAVYDAAVETFRQNATDIFMDCPSRERAGWLCDSFFTARSEYALTGKNPVEHAFLENFLLPESFACLPAGMLPMCYPADHYDGVYIPNWAMWYGLQLEASRARGEGEALIAAAKEKMYALAGFLAGFENASGLLQNLESWVFVEWSKANDFTQDVNYPTNMLYARFLEALANMYNDAALADKAARIKQTIRAQSFDGRFFRDHAVLQNGVPVPAPDHTETAQYYAFFTGVAAPETYPALFDTMCRDFGPGRDPETQYPDVPVSNAFIGNYLRLDMLYTAGRFAQLKREIRDFFLPMARATGTLWENMHSGASCCHGFASAVVHWLNDERVMEA